MADDAICPACEHSLGRHYRAADDTIRCLITESGTSTSGVIGLPWSRACDCRNGQSKHTDARRSREAAKAREDTEYFESLRREISAHVSLNEGSNNA